MPTDDYIKRDDALKVLCDKCVFESRCSRENEFCNQIQGIKAITTADVAPVIRCRDCKHAMMTYSGECKYCKMWMQDGVDEALYLDGDFYCAFAERKGENAEVR